MRVSKNTMLLNFVLAAFKLFAGLYASSAAMVSDAVHSASDVLSTVAVMVGIKLAGKDADKAHPYGHERFESVAAVLLSVLLFITGLGIGWGGVKTVLGASGELKVPGALALGAAVLSIIVKEGMYWYTKKAADKIGSSALKADAWHHRSDALSSIGSFVGIFGARMGLPILDPLASIVICLFILKAALDIFINAVNQLLDKACSDEMNAQITQIILAQEGVLTLDGLKTRLFGDRVYVDVEIGVDAAQSVRDAHEVARAVHDAIEDEFPSVKHCMVHVNPID